jgi:hypothetical protein
MRNMKSGLSRWGAFLGEICVLPMLYSAVLLDPFPYDWSRISAVALTAVVSCMLAYLSSSQFRNPGEINRLRLTQILAKPPFVVWITIIAIIALQLANRLMMLISVGKK